MQRHHRDQDLARIVIDGSFHQSRHEEQRPRTRRGVEAEMGYGSAVDLDHTLILVNVHIDHQAIGLHNKRETDAQQVEWKVYEGSGAIDWLQTASRC